MLLVALSLLASSLLAACDKRPATPSLLAGLKPTATSGVAHPERLNDNIRSPEGDNWDTAVTSTFSGPGSYAEFDLGSNKPIRSLYVQGDNNDEYVVSASEDGKNFKEIWVAPAIYDPGMRSRSTDSVHVDARYLKVAARGGDGRYSIGELQVFSDARGYAGASLEESQGLPVPESVRGKMLLLVLAAGLWLFLTWRHSPTSWCLVTLLLPLWAAASLYQDISDSWPLQMREVAFVRAAAAAIAALAVLREIVAPKAYPAHRVTVISAMAFAAMASFLAFFNLGQPQFRDHKANEPSFVHNFDMRVYYPVAKYFKELRYDGLYLASVAAYVDDDPHVRLESLGNVELRNLRTHRMTRVRDVLNEIRQIPKRFSPERWQEFKKDMRYFRETMGVSDYLGSMRDHGGNATPVWLAIAHLIYANTNASNATLTIGALLDPLLLLIAFAVIWRAFGVRTMLMSIVVFGANDFYMFGSNWAGATLRHDWMAYLALGICFLKMQRWTAGGVFLALSAAIRAFPALALAVMVIPVFWWLRAFHLRHGRFPTLADFWSEQRPVARIAIGAAVCAVVCVLFSSLLFSFDMWSEWLAKVSLLDKDPHVNDVSLRGLIAGSDNLQLTALGQRAPLFAVSVLLTLVALVFAARRKPLDQVAALGTLLIFVVFNPANYYMHFIFVLPVLALERPRDDIAPKRPPLSGYDGWIWGVLLIVCVAQYWTTLVQDVDLHFQLASGLMCALVVAILVLVLRRDLQSALPGLQNTRLCAYLRRTARDAGRPSHLLDAKEEQESEGDDEAEGDTEGDTREPA